MNLFAISKNLQNRSAFLRVPLSLFSHSLLFVEFIGFLLRSVSALILFYFLGTLSCSLITLFPGNYFRWLGAGAQGTGVLVPLWQAGNYFSLLGGQLLCLLHIPTPFRPHPGLRKVSLAVGVCLLSMDSTLQDGHLYNPHQICTVLFFSSYHLLNTQNNNDLNGIHIILRVINNLETI